MLWSVEGFRVQAYSALRRMFCQLRRIDGVLSVFGLGSSTPLRSGGRGFLLLKLPRPNPLSFGRGLHV